MIAHLANNKVNTKNTKKVKFMWMERFCPLFLWIFPGKCDSFFQEKNVLSLCASCVFTFVRRPGFFYMDETSLYSSVLCHWYDSRGEYSSSVGVIMEIRNNDSVVSQKPGRDPFHLIVRLSLSDTNLKISEGLTFTIFCANCAYILFK